MIRRRRLLGISRMSLYRHLGAGTIREARQPDPVPPRGADSSPRRGARLGIRGQPVSARNLDGQDERTKEGTS
jgi:hypothetical protein